METLYDVLGVDPDANPATIRRAYRERVKRHHPDVSDRDDTTEFRRLTAARDVLLDEDSRERYDSLGHRRYALRHLDGEEWPVSEPSRTHRSRPRRRVRSRPRRPRANRADRDRQRSRSSGPADGVVALRTYWPAMRRAGLVLLSLLLLAFVLTALSL